LLTNIMIYWATGTITSSTRLYYESRKTKRFGPVGVGVPTGCAVFPEELFNPPRAWAEAYYNIQQWSVFDKGGHFAALEQPDALVGDIRSFFAKVR